MSISSSHIFPTQPPPTFRYIQETILSNKQILEGLVLQAIGFTLLPKRTPLQKLTFLQLKMLAAGVLIQIVGTTITASSREQTYQKATALIISGIAMLAISSITLSTIEPDSILSHEGLLEGSCLLASGILGCATVRRMEQSRQTPETEEFGLSECFLELSNHPFFESSTNSDQRDPL